MNEVPITARMDWSAEDLNTVLAMTRVSIKVADDPIAAARQTLPIVVQAERGLLAIQQAEQQRLARAMVIAEAEAAAEGQARPPAEAETDPKERRRQAGVKAADTRKANAARLADKQPS